MKNLSLSLTIALVFVAIGGCTSEAEKRAQAEQAAALASTRTELEQVKAKLAAEGEAQKAKAAAEAEANARKEEAKKALLGNPAALIEAQGAQFHTKGIFNKDYELVKVSLINKSHFAVRSIQGTVDFMNNGAKVAGVEFSVPISIGPGETKTVSKADGTLNSAALQTKASRISVKVTHVALVE